jgi:hypothetical protein
MSLNFYLQCKCCHTIVFEIELTHNLNKMAMQAGLYAPLWYCNDETDSAHPRYQYAQKMIPVLTEGIQNLQRRPEYFRQFNPSNGWGTYDQLLKAALDLLETCRRYPDAEPISSR